MILDRSKILAANPSLPTEDVFVAEWSGSVRVRTLTATERDDLELKWEQTKRKHFRARLVAACVCDEQGNRLFSEADVVAIGAKSTAAIQTVYDVAIRLNRFTKEDVEELAKNSESGPSEGSSSDSPH